MQSDKYRAGLSITIILFLFTVFHLWAPAVSAAETQQSGINALYLLTVPSEYEALEEVVKSAGDNGANTIIMPLVSKAGIPDKQTLAKAVFFAHAAGMKLFVIVPTRDLSTPLQEHSNWEDLQYDLRSGTVQPAGKLDIFNEKAATYISEFIKDIAGYSVDAILLDEDFFYGDAEGMSENALTLYKQKYGSSFSARAAFAKVRGEGPEKHMPAQYGESFWKLAELKKEMLLLLLNNIIESAQMVNKQVKFVIPLPAPGLFLAEKEMLAWYSLDVAALQKMDTNLFWLSIRHRDIRTQNDINYKKTIEIVSRIAVTSLSLIKDPSKIIIAIQTTSESRKLLPIFEIEEVASQAKKSGQTGIAFMIEPDVGLPPVLTKKIFRREQE